MQHIIPFVWLIILSVSLCATIFGIYYLSSKENMALIERGINPRERTTHKFPGFTLKLASCLIGAGLGLVAAFQLDLAYASPDDSAALYFGLIALGAGLGLFMAYRAEMRWIKKHMEQQPSQG